MADTVKETIDEPPWRADKIYMLANRFLCLGCKIGMLIGLILPIPIQASNYQLYSSDWLNQLRVYTILF